MFHEASILLDTTDMSGDEAYKMARNIVDTRGTLFEENNVGPD